MGPWTIGALANHLWDVGGDNSDINATFLQPFVSVRVGPSLSTLGTPRLPTSHLVANRKIPSIFDLMSVEEQKSGKLDALRWWLTMKYDSVRHSSDGDAFEFVGSSVQCLSENQFLNTQGQQVLTGKSEGANLAFAQTFSSKYEELAKQDLVFADLRNVFDLALVASLLEHRQIARQTGWNYGCFSGDGAYRTRVYDAPLEVESVVNHRVYRGRDIVVQVAGGVRADLGEVLTKKLTAGPRMEDDAEKAQASVELPARRWWWDAK